MALKRASFRLADLAAAKKLPLDWLQESCELRDLDSGAIGIPYFDEWWNELFVRRRNPPGTEPRFQQPRGVRLQPYGLNRLDAARKVRRLYMCEGESDTWTLWYCGLPTLGLPGAGATKALAAEHIENIYDLYLLPDNDDAGEQFAAGVRRRFAELGYGGRLHRISVPVLHKDVSEWYVAASDKAQFQGQLETAIRSAELLHVEARKAPGNGITGNGRSSRAEAAGPENKPRIRELRVRTLATIKATPTKWLWRGYIPLGALTILDGDPGLGKSTIIGADLAARVSRGFPMPPVEGKTDLDGPADVLILNAEDSPEQTIRPRLDAAGADVNRVHVIDATRIGERDERPPILPADLDLLEEQAQRHRAKLIEIDPFMAYLDGELDAHRDQDVRRCLHRLKLLAENTGAAVVLVRHLNKLNAGPALYRGGGSIGISGGARSVLMVGKNPSDPTQLVLAPIKCNLCERPPALTYSIHTAANGVSVIGWGQETTLDCDDLLGHRRQGVPVAEECAELIRTLLADGPKPATDIEGELRAKGFSDNAIRDGRKRAKVKAVKREGFGEAGGWLWRLPSADEEGNDVVQVPPGW